MDDETQASKDWWDKAEICGKVLGAVIVPLAVAGVALIWNGQSSARQSAAQMSAIAIGILQTEPKPGLDSSALRDWAVSVLQDPTDPPKLSEEAANEMRFMGLPLAEFSKSAIELENMMRRLRAGELEPGELTAPVVKVDPVIIPDVSLDP